MKGPKLDNFIALTDNPNTLSEIELSIESFSTERDNDEKFVRSQLEAINNLVSKLKGCNSSALTEPETIKFKQLLMKLRDLHFFYQDLMAKMINIHGLKRKLEFSLKDCCASYNVIEMLVDWNCPYCDKVMFKEVPECKIYIFFVKYMKKV
jgi:hypothetical protein